MLAMTEAYVWAVVWERLAAAEARLAGLDARVQVLEQARESVRVIV